MAAKSSGLETRDGLGARGSGPGGRESELEIRAAVLGVPGSELRNETCSVPFLPESRGPGPEPRMRNFRYSAFFIRPSSQTTIEATVSLPWMVEMSKHSIRRGSVGSDNTTCSVLSASYCAAAA